MLIKSNFLAHLDYAAWYNHYVSSQITYFKLRFNTIAKTIYFNYYKTKIPSLLTSFIKQKSLVQSGEKMLVSDHTMCILHPEWTILMNEVNSNGKKNV